MNIKMEIIQPYGAQCGQNTESELMALAGLRKILSGAVSSIRPKAPTHSDFSSECICRIFLPT